MTAERSLPELQQLSLIGTKQTGWQQTEGIKFYWRRGCTLNSVYNYYIIRTLKVSSANRSIRASESAREKHLVRRTDEPKCKIVFSEVD